MSNTKLKRKRKAFKIVSFRNDDKYKKECNKK